MSDIPLKGFSTARVSAGPQLHLAGHVPLDRDGRLVGLGDPAAQAEQVFRNLAATLTEHGACLAGIIQLTIYLADRVHADAVRAVRARTFSPPLPAATIIIVGLLHSEWLLEIEAIATVPVSEQCREVGKGSIHALRD